MLRKLVIKLISTSGWNDTRREVGVVGLFFVSEAIRVIVRNEFLRCFFVTAARIPDSCVPIDERRLVFVGLPLLTSLISDAGSTMITLSSLIVLLMFQD